MSVETFELLLAPNLAAVRNFVRTRVKAADQADDIVQQTLLHAFQFRHQLQSPSKFRSWIWSIALNEVRMFFRVSRPHTSLDSLSYPFTDPAPSPHVMCERGERARRLRAGMAILSPRDRAAIQLADLRGLTVAEAADAMALSVPAFKSTHFRARQRLGNVLRRAPVLTDSTAIAA